MIRVQKPEGRRRADKFILKRSQWQETSRERDRNARRTFRSLLICWGFSVRSADTRGVKPNKSPPGASRLISDHTQIFSRPPARRCSAFRRSSTAASAGRWEKEGRAPPPTGRTGSSPSATFLLRPLGATFSGPVFGPPTAHERGRGPTVFARLAVNKGY